MFHDSGCEHFTLGTGLDSLAADSSAGPEASDGPDEWHEGLQSSCSDERNNEEHRDLHKAMTRTLEISSNSKLVVV